MMSAHGAVMPMAMTAIATTVTVSASTTHSAMAHLTAHLSARSYFAKSKLRLSRPQANNGVIPPLKSLSPACFSIQKSALLRLARALNIFFKTGKLLTQRSFSGGRYATSN